MNILIRTDASRNIGSGHIMRCGALAEALRSAGHKVVFLCRDDGKGLTQRLLKDVNAIYMSSEFTDQNQDARDSLEQIKKSGQVFDWVVVDHYALGREWETAIRNSIPRIAVIDDLADRGHDCDLLIDQNFYAGDINPYLPLNQRPALYFIGPRYALLRPAFARSREEKQTLAKKLGVFLSGTDPHGDTLKVVKALKAMPEKGQEVEIIAAPGIPGRADILEIAKTRKNWRVLEHVDDMALWLKGIGLAICSGGGFTWERSCMGVPAVTVCIAGNQKRGLEALASEGYVVYLGESRDVKAEQLAEAVTAMEDQDKRNKLAARTMALTDGKGAARVVAAMENIASPFSLRPAVETDMRNLWEWRNHPEVRRFSHDTQEIPLETHEAWFHKTLQDKSRNLLVVTRAGEDAGVVRLDQKDKSTLYISIYFAPAFIGKRAGGGLLRDAECWVRENLPLVRQIEADILPGNARSLAVFIKAGYMHQEGTLYARQWE